MKIKCLFLSIVLLAFGGSFGFCDYYEFTDKDGVVHFTDNPGTVPSWQIENSDDVSVPAQKSKLSKKTNTFKAKETYLPVQIGDGWQFVDANVDSDPKLTVTASRKLIINGKEHIVIDWIVDDLLELQSDYWLIRDDGVYVGGTSILGKETIYERPYLLMKHDAKVGMKWSWPDGMKTVVEKKEKIKTPNGSFNTLKVVSYIKDLKVERWYAKNVGLIKFATYTKFGNRFLLSKEDHLASIIHNEVKRNKDNSLIVHQNTEIERPKGDALTAQQLTANWQYYDFDGTIPSIVSWELLSEGTFKGSFSNPKPYWQYAGKWWIKNRKIYSKSTVSLKGIDDSQADDVDEVLEINDEYMTIRCETDGTTKKFWRHPNKSLEKKMNF